MPYKVLILPSSNSLVIHEGRKKLLTVFEAESSNPKIGPSKFLLGYICLFFILFFNPNFRVWRVEEHFRSNLRLLYLILLRGGI